MTEDTQNPAQTVAASPLVWVLQVLLAVPVIGWVVLVLTRSWVPHGDLAIIAMHTRDVFSFHPPMLGMPSTGFLIVEGNDAHHPGPLQFYLLAIPYRLAGGAPWMLLIASAVLILGLMALGVMAGRAAAGTQGALTVFLTNAYLVVSVGPNIVEPWNPWPAMFGSLAAIACAWAILRGRQVWWLGFVFAGSVAAQSHLAAAPVMLVVGLVLVGVVVQRAITERDAADHAIVWFYAGIVLILLWIPPLADVILHSGGNLKPILQLSGAGGDLGPVILVVGIVAGASIWAWPLVVAGHRASILVLGVLSGLVIWWLAGRIGGHSGTDYVEYVSGTYLVAVGWLIALMAVPLVERLPRVSCAVAVVGAFLAIGTLDEGRVVVREDPGHRQLVVIANEAIAHTHELLADVRHDKPIEPRTNGALAWSDTRAAVCIDLLNAGRKVWCGDALTLGREDDFRNPALLPGSRTVVMMETGSGPVPQPRRGEVVMDLAALLHEHGLDSMIPETWMRLHTFVEDPVDR